MCRWVAGRFSFAALLTPAQPAALSKQPRSPTSTAVACWPLLPPAAPTFCHPCLLRRRRRLLPAGAPRGGRLPTRHPPAARLQQRLPAGAHRSGDGGIVYCLFQLYATACAAAVSSMRSMHSTRSCTSRSSDKALGSGGGCRGRSRSWGAGGLEAGAICFCSRWLHCALRSSAIDLLAFVTA